MKVLNTIGGFEVEVTDETNDEGRVECFVGKEKHGTKFCSSLAVVEDYGFIEPDDERAIRVPENTVERIRTFAQKHGY